jgi:hypothetical protein
MILTAPVNVFKTIDAIAALAVRINPGKAASGIIVGEDVAVGTSPGYVSAFQINGFEGTISHFTAFDGGT